MCCAISAMPVGSSSPRYGLMWEAMIEMPRNVVPRIPPITAIVSAALRDSGRRNAGTPFDTASTPDSATAPDEKALSSIRIESAWVPSLISSASGESSPLATMASTSIGPRSWTKMRYSPTTTSMISITMYR